jgi:ribosomal-protein-alanine N-acetyltransferase
MGKILMIHTKRLYLRALEENDIDNLMHIWGNSEVMKFSGGAGTYDMEKRSLSFYMNLQKEKGYAPYAVILKDNNVFIGVCGFNPPHDGGSVEIMYHFAKPFWGKGYATESAIAVINYVKSNLDFHELSAYVDPNNQKSMRVLEKLGFTYEGVKFHKISQKEEAYYIIHL